MLSSSNTEIVHALQSLQETNPNIQAVALARIEGSVLESTSLSMVEKVQVGSTSAALLAIANKMCTYMRLGDAKQIQLKGDTGAVLLFRVGKSAILAVIINGETKLEAISAEAFRLASRLSVLV
ncbi:MAG: roadblock/LC7 domain-containing protein [Acidobacteriota bacterium]